MESPPSAIGRLICQVFGPDRVQGGGQASWGCAGEANLRTTSVAPTESYGVGTRWQARSGGEVITVARTSQTPTRNSSVILYHLSNGHA